MQETEITVQLLDDFGTINKILLDQGFKMLENYQINDYYYSKHDFIKEMSYPEMIRNSFLVREIIDDHPFAMLTYKDKKFDDKGNVISEEKTKLRIASANEALEIFNKAGLNMWCNLCQDLFVYEKGDVSFAVQVVKDLGIFLEYEDEAMQGLGEQEKIEKMITNIKLLGLNIGDDYFCKKVYMKVMSEN